MISVFIGNVFLTLTVNILNLNVLIHLGSHKTMLTELLLC